MGASYLAVSAASTVLSFVGLQLWTVFSLDKLRTDGLIGENIIHLENANRVLELLLGSYATVALLANFVLNGFILLILFLKTIFFVELYLAETRKFVERLVNYVIYKALLSAIIKRIKGFVKLRIALGHLHAALPDATSEELREYDDECTICREPMAKAQKLNCNHLFHIACLRSWSDQGFSERCSCPTCRKPLFVGRPAHEANPCAREVSSDEQLACQLSLGLDRQNNSGQTLPTGVFLSRTQNPVKAALGGQDFSWLPSWPSQGVDGAGPSTPTRSGGLGRIQMMMMHLASVGETYAQTSIEDTAWSLWPTNSSQAGASGSPSPPAVAGRYTGITGGLHNRSLSHSANDNIVNMLSMGKTVREVLPHIPDELIFQDLRRTNSATVTANNLFQM